jgi:small subunit ribosomal protein S6
MFIVNPELNEAELEAMHNRIQDYLEEANATVFSLKEWGLRRLTYSIKGHKEGRYYLSHFEMDTQKLAPFEQSLKLVEGVLREMVTLLQGEPIVDAPVAKAPVASPVAEPAPSSDAPAPSEEVEEDTSNAA